jgi:hypothetical protein
MDPGRPFQYRDYQKMRTKLKNEDKDGLNVLFI